MRKILFFFSFLLFTNCKLVDKEYPIQIKQLPSSQNILLTSDTDIKFILLYIPIEIEITNKWNKKIMLGNILNNQCDTLQKVPFIKNAKGQIGFAFSEDESYITSKKSKKYTIYKFFKINPNDEIWKKQLKFIKRNCNESTKYFNDTIKYKSLSDLKKDHLSFYINEVSTLNCDELSFSFLIFDKEAKDKNDTVNLNVQYQ